MAAPVQCHDIHLHSNNPENTRTLRVVHISDTHLLHEGQLQVPDGDIVIHSGDFAQAKWYNALPTHKNANERQLQGFLQFFKKLPHKHKIFVCGNHERLFYHSNWKSVQEKLGDDIIYLQDWGVDIDGLRIWGSPWNRTNGAYGASRSFRAAAWSKIPAGTDIVVTHIGGIGHLDLCWRKNKGKDTCADCGKDHLNYVHEGCPDLSQHVKRSGAKVHLFGHAHDSNGFKDDGGVLHVNSAMELNGPSHFFDVVLSTTERNNRNGVVQWSVEHGWSSTSSVVSPAIHEGGVGEEKKSATDDRAVVVGEITLKDGTCKKASCDVYQTWKKKFNVAINGKPTIQEDQLLLIFSAVECVGNSVVAARDGDGCRWSATATMENRVGGTYVGSSGSIKAVSIEAKTTENKLNSRCVVC